MRELKQAEKVLVGLILANGDWLLPQHFMRPSSGDLFVGYEASARLSEAAREYPDVIESRQEGRFKARRFRTDCTVEAFSKLPSIVRERTKQALFIAGFGKCRHERVYRSGNERVCANKCGWSEVVTA